MVNEGLALIKRFRRKTESSANRKKLLNYGPDSVGLRSPVAPVGLIVQDSGVVAMYAGRARLYIGLTGMLVASADCVGVQGNMIYMNPRDIRSFKILGKSFVPEVFSGDKKVAVISKSNLDKLTSMYLVTRASRATETGITDIHPLGEVLEALDFFQSEYQCPDISMDKFQTLAAGLGLSFNI